MQRAGFLHHGARHLRRGLPQLSPRISIRLPQWREALELRSNEMDHLDAFEDRLHQESQARACGKSSGRRARAGREPLTACAVLGPKKNPRAEARGLSLFTLL